MTRTTTPRRDDAGSRQSAPENRSRAATAAYPTKNDLPEAARGEAVALLNQRLADCIDLQTQCKQAHWNVKGPTFIALHKLFDEINEDVEGYVDLIAERVVQLGGIAEGTVGVVHPCRLSARACNGCGARGRVVGRARRIRPHGSGRHRRDERARGRGQRRYPHRDLPGRGQVALVRGSAPAGRVTP